MVWLWLGSTALGWELAGHKLAEPVEWLVVQHDYPGVSDEVGAVQGALDAWVDPVCAPELDMSIGDTVTPDADGEWPGADYEILLGDPQDWLGSFGLGAMFFSGSGDTTVDGYRVWDRVTIVLHEQTPFTDDPEGDCADAYDLQSILTHYLGHVVGLTHPTVLTPEVVVDGSVIDDFPEHCESLRLPRVEDLDGLQFLYGALGAPRCFVDVPGYVVGGLPLTITCDTVPHTDHDPVSLATTWSIDGGPPIDGPTLAHTVEEPGGVTIEGCVAGATGCPPTCRTFALTACGAPSAELDPRVRGATVTLRNDTENPLAGCIDEVRWEVRRDGGLVAQPSTWEPTLELDPGRYEATVFVAGPGGSDQARQSFEVRSDCSCASGTASLDARWLVPLLGRQR